MRIRALLLGTSAVLSMSGSIDSTAVQRAREARGHVVVLTAPMGAAALAYVPALLRAGAAGVVIAVTDSTAFRLFARSRGDARYYVDAHVDDPVWQADLPVIIAGPELARRLIDRSSSTLSFENVGPILKPMVWAAAGAALKPSAKSSNKTFFIDPHL